MTELHDEQLEQGRRRAWLVFLVAAPLVYLLSLGPICTLTARGWMSPRVYDWLAHGPYRPALTLMAGGGDYGWIGALYQGYIMWWTFL